MPCRDPLSPVTSRRLGPCRFGHLRCSEPWENSSRSGARCRRCVSLVGKSPSGHLFESLTRTNRSEALPVSAHGNILGTISDVEVRTVNGRRRSSRGPNPLLAANASRRCEGCWVDAVGETRVRNRPGVRLRRYQSCWTGLFRGGSSSNRSSATRQPEHRPPRPGWPGLRPPPPRLRRLLLCPVIPVAADLGAVGLCSAEHNPTMPTSA